MFCDSRIFIYLLLLWAESGPNKQSYAIWPTTYLLTYLFIDGNITDGIVGARKYRNIRDNIFVLGEVVNSLVNGTEKPVQVQVVGVEIFFSRQILVTVYHKCNIWKGVQKELLITLYIENKFVKVAM